MHRRVADDALFAHLALPRLELRLDEGQEDPSFADEPERRRDDVPQRDEGRVDRREIDGLLDPHALEVADVGPLEEHDAGVVAQRPGDLPVAHVHGIDLPGPLLQQAVREPPRRGAHVEGCEPVDADPEGIQGPLELHAAAAHVGVILAANSDIRGFGNERPGLVDGLLVDEHRPGKNEGPCPLPGRNEAPVHEKHVEPGFGGFFFHGMADGS